ncbi:prephenate dehydrogenase [Candidatus Falkowbacteria bacterium RBG_13_39_14]|uniref:Prephenate dehydrogenase n=1 Tax=Candidatus Falkowbacteria bacterium RBG_13_39_14 TaxID=1797985 RepID=A0A1F5S466_9BACT|nr:MAG: prephenate dehydrogenase [Candidatus Falkowbacteria bacterium RBG_13_39_14]
MKRSIGIIGFGNFSRFMIKHLSPFFDISVYARKDIAEDALKLNVKSVSLEEAASQDIIIPSVPLDAFEEVILRIKNIVKPGSIVVDVTSVKVRPVELMEKYLPPHAEILATHPLFGPESGKNGIEGLRIVLCPVRVNNLELITKFLSDNLRLQVLMRTPDEHDRQMAFVQGLTHFIARAANELDIADFDQKTMAYQKLLDIKELLGGDSDALFLTMEKGNPYAKEAREKFMRTLEKIEKFIERN